MSILVGCRALIWIHGDVESFLSAAAVYNREGCARSGFSQASAVPLEYELCFVGSGESAGCS